MASPTAGQTVEKSQETSADHIANLPPEVRHEIEQLDAAISAAMPGHAKTLWEGKFWGGSDQQIIGYGDYTYQRPKGDTVEWFIVGLAVQKNYISVYVNATDGGGYLAQKYANKLGKAKVGKSSIGFRSVEDIDLGVLIDLVTRAGRQAP